MSCDRQTSVALGRCQTVLRDAELRLEEVQSAIANASPHLTRLAASDFAQLQNVDLAFQTLRCVREYIGYIAQGELTPKDLHPTDIANMLIMGNDVPVAEDADYLF